MESRSRSAMSWRRIGSSLRPCVGERFSIEKAQSDPSAAWWSSSDIDNRQIHDGGLFNIAQPVATLRKSIAYSVFQKSERDAPGLKALLEAAFFAGLKARASTEDLSRMFCNKL